MLHETHRKIKRLKIQGAENISTAGILALEYVIKKSHSFTEIENATKKLISARPTEPQLENYLYYITKFRKEHTQIETLKEIKRLLKEKKEAHKKIMEHGKKLIEKNDIVFTHCHSSNVIGVLKKCKKIKVYNTETRPRYQGRKTAKELAKARIPVTHFIDSAARIAIKESDIVLLGADSITYNKVYNKIGSELMALTAKNYKVPVYICASLWKFNPHRETIEERPIKEVWKNPPKGVKVKNYAFEKINFSLIKGIVCEEGILKPKKFVKKARKLLNVL
ncbi:ribose 1,5-bisphosphate isomerase [archaeon]|jgi:ribose 1,5-bisphosphate isomerase|nr:ribose 1,5-bisphosphate isomerase [archaeon]MBT4397283.1 ribose 1,5-bisphosphate isomerase [archaeon]MBT4440663.1 ribose 1,5-bisphosphate isomerase [archaeon]